MSDSHDPADTVKELPLRPAASKIIDDTQQTDPLPETSEDKPDSTPNSPKSQSLEELPIEIDQAKKKKKKSKARPKSKRGKNKPTGFEEYYVDAPITPEEFSAEKELYNVSRPLTHRIEDALLRYQKNRRLESDRRDVFLKYLAYGGVNVGQRMFGGLDGRDLQQLDSEQILQARAMTSVGKDKSNLAVDFDAVVRGFLTSFFPYYFNPDTKDMIKLATVTIRNFLSYLLYHDVCSEYNDNIDQARTSCDIATRELWNNQQLMAKGPGDFNSCCSLLFGGELHDTYTEGNQWRNSKDDAPRLTTEIARKIVKFALAGAGENRHALRFQELTENKTLCAVRIEDIDGFEITAVHPPGEVVREFYQTHAPDLVPVGKLLARTYRDPGMPDYDRSPEERVAQPERNFELFMEGNLLQYCYPGMKVIAPVWELNCGFHYFEYAYRTYGSNYTPLVNDLMLGWKEPRDLAKAESKAESDGEDDSSVTL
ncbi:Argonaute complex, subunit Arb1 [Aspergillus welwitschiae]|uniref:Argonaute complex, subunit Arb1 n=1 Tax=Aspergillus welwitschiae TaxID=1341132 RepID=A0A3F3PYC1_9EURO|nr:Argonaute complex, subunit Arb1 [Aspergillus welwitschiae]RDH31847.1 Argonaute complex, subunit Arb1 [Aspergillus welwitschiae]